MVRQVSGVKKGGRFRAAYQVALFACSEALSAEGIGLGEGSGALVAVTQMSMYRAGGRRRVGGLQQSV